MRMVIDIHLWNIGGSGTVEDFSYIVSIFIAPSTQLEAERPIRWHERFADDICELLNNICWGRTEENEEFQHAADCSKC